MSCVGGQNPKDIINKSFSFNQGVVFEWSNIDLPGYTFYKELYAVRV